MYAAVSYRYKGIIQILSSMGLEVIEVPSYNEETENYESSHADMQILKVDNVLFLLKDNDKFNDKIIDKTCDIIKYTDKSISKFVYPDCVKLNMAVIGRKIIANTHYIDHSIVNAFPDYDLIHVSQGYAKCSSAIVSDKAVITSDESIYKACISNNIDCLRIQPGYISLCERYGGFIGGSCFQLNDILYFTGNLEPHPDYESIKAFCLNYSVHVRSLANSPLTDVGGVVLF